MRLHSYVWVGISWVPEFSLVGTTLHPNQLVLRQAGLNSDCKMESSGEAEVWQGCRSQIFYSR